jgi:hypothetical protein
VWSIDLRAASLVLLFFFGFAAPLLAQPSQASSLRAEGSVQNGRKSMWSSVDFPWPAEALCQAAGILVPIERTRLVLEIARLSYSTPETKDQRVDRVRTRVQSLLLLARTGAASSPVRVPLPLPAEVWLETVFGGGLPAADLGRGILADSRAALLYHGLFALDDETLEYLADTKNGTLIVCLANARVFSKFGRSLRIRDGRVDVPGGPPAVALWEELLGAPVTDPRGFAARLFSRDRGWLAYFYDVLAHLDPPHLAFTLGLSAPDPDARPARFKALYAATARADPSWVPSDRPFAPPTHDLSLLLNEVRLTADNRFAPPSSRLFCKAAFTGEPLTTNDDGTLRLPAPQDEVDAAFLVEQVVAQTPGIRQERFETILFGQRLLANGFQSDPLDATALGRIRRHEELDAVLKAMQGVSRFRALVLTLERAGVRSPLTVAAAVRAAEAISAIKSTEHRALATVQFQAAVALVDRLEARHALSPSTASNAIRSLADATLAALKSEPPTGYNGAVGAWFTSSLLPWLPRSVRPGLDPDSPEDVLLNALAGPSGPAGGALDSVRVPWEGGTYRIDLGAAELSRLRRAYRALGGGGLDLALDLSRLATGVISDRGALQRAAEHALPLVDRWQPAGAAGVAPRKAQDVRRAASQLRDRLAGPGNEPLADVRGRMGPYADAVMADTLASLVYALSLGEPDSVLVSSELVARHRFNYAAPTSMERERETWSVPTEVRGGGQPWSFVGSLLAFDVPLASLALRRMSIEALPRAPTINKYDAHALMHTVTLLDAYAMTDRDQQAIVEAIGRGLGRVGELTHAANGANALGLATAAGLSEWRANGLRWALREEPAAVLSWFSLTELMWLGDPGLPPEALDAWGVSIYDLTGMLGCRFPRPAPWEDLAGRLFGGLVATRIPDLGLRLAQWLSGLHLPAALLPALMTRAMQDLLDQAQPSDPYDWTAIVRAAANMTRARFEDYVSTLTTEGPLMPLPPSSPLPAFPSTSAPGSSPPPAWRRVRPRCCRCGTTV